MDSEKQREIARKGGRKAHEKGTAHEFSRDEAREAGRKGGLKVAQNRAHMAEIGRQGGIRVHMLQAAAKAAATMTLPETVGTWEALNGLPFPATKEAVMAKAGESKIATGEGSIALQDIIAKSEGVEFQSLHAA
jgi:general stress protein YciG